MKSLLLVLALVSGNLFSQIDPNVTFLNKALSEGDAITVGTFFDNTIELTLLDKQTMLKKDAAVTALKDFFLKKKVSTKKKNLKKKKKSQKNEKQNFLLFFFGFSGGGFFCVFLILLVMFLCTFGFSDYTIWNNRHMF